MSQMHKKRSISEFLSALKQCTKTRDLEHGKKLHIDAVAAGCHTNKYIASALITMYSKCRNILHARQVFDGMTHRDVVLWTSLIMGYVENGESVVALDLFSKMSCEPNSITVVAALKACAGLASEKRQFCLRKGMDLHRLAMERGYDKDLIVANTLISIYTKCGSISQARDVFDNMVHRNVASWTTLMMGYVENGESSTAIDLFMRMDCEPDFVIFIAALKACIGLASKRQQFCLEKGMAIHNSLREHGFLTNTYVGNALIDMYSKCGSVWRARDVFEGMTQRDVVTWSCLMQGYVESGQSLVALEMFMRMDCEPDSLTFVTALKACTGMKEFDREFVLETGMMIHKQARERGFDSNIFVANKVMEMYGKLGSMHDARGVFDNMVDRNVVSWTALILAYVENGECSVAIELFTRMDCEPDSPVYVVALKACIGLATENYMNRQACLERGIDIHMQVRERGFDSDTLVASTLIEFYSACRSMSHAQEVFDKMTQRTSVTWCSLILGYVECEESSRALEMFLSMDCQPDSVTFVAAIKACRSLSRLSIGRHIHAQVCGMGLEQDQVLGNCLVDFYGKFGNTSAAEHVFNTMQNTNTISWSALIAVYSSLGDTPRVFSLVTEMQEAEVPMNGITVLSILTACNHSGMVDKGRNYFDSMHRHGVIPNLEHYNCLIDMLGRDNRLQEALEVVNGMPFEANHVTWTSLLGASNKWKNVEVGKVAFDALMAANSTDSGPYVLMSDIYHI